MSCVRKQMLVRGKRGSKLSKTKKLTNVVCLISIIGSLHYISRLSILKCLKRSRLNIIEEGHIYIVMGYYAQIMVCLYTKT